MKKAVIMLLLLSALALTAVKAQAQQTNPGVASTGQTLPVPRELHFAYTNGTRSADGKPGPNYWQNHSIHNMHITVAPPSRTISATQEITYVNNSPYPLSEVIFKLIQNVHRPDAMREYVYDKRFFNDGLQIDEFRVNGVAQPWGPDSGLLGIHKVPISPTLASKASVTFSIRWHYEITDLIQRTKEGAVDNTTFFLGYFFPRVAVLDDLYPNGFGFDGNEFSYSERELYNDFADFTVAVTAPKNFIVWATGDLQNPAEVLQPDYAQRLQESLTSDKVINIAQPDELQKGLVTAQSNTVTWQWQAQNVPDFVVALSDHYVWDAGSVVVDPASGRRASVQAAYDKPSEDFQQMVEFAKSALAFGSTEWPGVPYPYSKTTVFRGGADEEYPMFANDSSTGNPMFTRFVAAHELLHSWFPFYMGTNEQRYGFMDEGWTTAFEYLINTRDMGAEGAVQMFQHFRSSRLVTPFAGLDTPIITPNDMMIGNVITANSYGKAGLGYLALKELMGDPLFKQALHEFIARWNGKHPTPWDMFNTFNDATGQRTNWFFSNWFFAANYLDVAIGAVQKTASGYTVQIKNVGGKAMPFDLKVVYGDDTNATFRQSPAVWQNSPDLITVTLTSTQTVKSITADGGIFMDATPNDNVWQNPDAPASATTSITTTAATTVTAPMTTTAATTMTAPTTTTTTVTTTLAWQPCAEPLSATLECAQMQAPLDYAAPNGPTITLGLTRIKAADPAKRIGSLIINPGGPGGEGSAILDAVAKYNLPFIAKLRQYFDLVGLDPRGVGLSTPVKCDPEIWNESGSLFPKDKAAYDAMVAHNKAFGESCLKNTGPVLAHLDTVSVARDLDAIRAALGDEKLNYFGLSYGTMIGAQYAELFPDKIRVMALDGALDHSQSENTFHFVEVKAYELVFERFAAWCGANKECALHGKDVLKEFDALIKQADATPIPAPDCAASGKCRATVTGDDIRASIQEHLLKVATWPGLGESLAKAMNGDASDFAFELKTDASNSDFSETAIQCLDWTSATNATFEGLQARRIFDIATAPHTQGAAQSWRAQTRCLGWPVPVTNPPRPLVVKGAPPILIINATDDPSTSMQWALEMSNQLPSAVLLIREGYGHTTYSNPGESQVRAVIDEYLITGKTPPPNTVLPN